MLSNSRVEPIGVREILVAAVISLFIANGVFGGAIEVGEQGAKADAQADAFAAQADDPSAIYYNPAGLTQLHGTVISNGFLVFLPEIYFKGPTGEQSLHTPSYLPQLYAVTDFGTSNWRFGIGVDDVFGLNEKWSNSGPLSAVSTKADLELLSIAPTVAYRIDSHLSLGIAFDVYYGEVKLERRPDLPPPYPSGAQGESGFKGNGLSFGVTPGLMWKINDQNTVALVYRSPFSLDFSGRAKLFAPHAPAVGPADADASIRFPQMFDAAYALWPTPCLKLEADVEYVNWNTVKEVQLKSSNTVLNGMAIRDEWVDGWSYRFGAQYEVDRHWTLRGGCGFGQNSIPSATFSPVVPDSNYHLYSVGVGYSTPQWTLDFAYQYIFRERRHISDSIYSPLVDGTWDNTVHSISVMLTVKL